MVRDAFFSIREMALSERSPIHSEVQTFAGSGAVAHPVSDSVRHAKISEVPKCFISAA